MWVYSQGVEDEQAGGEGSKVLLKGLWAVGAAVVAGAVFPVWGWRALVFMLGLGIMSAASEKAAEWGAVERMLRLRRLYREQERES